MPIIVFCLGCRQSQDSVIASASRAIVGPFLNSGGAVLTPEGVVAIPDMLGASAHEMALQIVHRELSEAVTLQLVEEKVVFRGDPTSSVRSLYRLAYDSHLLCEGGFVAIDKTTGENLFLNGWLPFAVKNMADPEDHDVSPEDVYTWLLSQKSLSATEPYQSAEACIMPTELGPVAAYRFHFVRDDLPHIAVASTSEIFQFYAQVFSAAEFAGDGKVFDVDRNGSLVSVPFSLTQADRLQNDFLTTVLRKDENGNLSSDHAVPVSTTSGVSHFDFSGIVGFQDSMDFEETSVFANADRILAWFQDMGYGENVASPLELVLDLPGVNLAGANDPKYIPGQTTKIVLPAGRPNSVNSPLDNLRLDTDVLYHEFSHHIIFSSITSADGESLVLHEGLADFFAIQKNDDPCLGNTICVSGSDCEIALTCLRTAENTFALDGQNLPTSAHKRSQFVSGFLWDLRTETSPSAAPPIAKEVLSCLVFRSLPFMPPEAGYTDLIVALLASDYYFAGGLYGCQILEMANARGMSAVTNGLSCASPKIDFAEIDTYGYKTCNGELLPKELQTPEPSPSSTPEPEPEVPIEGDGAIEEAGADNIAGVPDPAPAAENEDNSTSGSASRFCSVTGIPMTGNLWFWICFLAPLFLSRLRNLLT